MIKLSDITLAVDNRKILQDVTIDVEPGQTAVILGPSGAGKSTILKAILGLWKPSNGRIFIDRQEISRLPEKKMFSIRRDMALVFQSNALFDSMNVADNVAYFLREQNSLSEDEIAKRVGQALAFVNLKEVENLFPDELSGGMKKRVAIARAIVLRPKVILYDEPTTGLDPINARMIIDLINKIKQRGTTSIIVTHILREATMVADKLIIINEGRVVETGTVENLLNSKNEFIREFFAELYQGAELIDSSDEHWKRALAV